LSELSMCFRVSTGQPSSSV